ncbi:hypothetical protein GCM10009663_08860 [Kitasatospora arboriphila]|uniref:Uncharacterized protein n=1 Tax=Kitasatospora arboriphila TaxID=258052 RepID=A0ABN1TAM3_9ACTN
MAGGPVRAHPWGYWRVGAVRVPTGGPWVTAEGESGKMAPVSGLRSRTTLFSYREARREPEA